MPSADGPAVAELRRRGSGAFRLYASDAFEDARRYYEAEFDTELSTDQLRGGWADWAATAGRFEGVCGTVHGVRDGFDVVKLVGAFEAGLVAMDFVFDGAGAMIGSFHSSPNTGTYSLPAYAASDALEESETTIAGPCNLPAVDGHDPLSVPTLRLFGGRDFEATAADRERWASNGEVRVVDAASHLLQPGDAPATPGEYALPNTVAESAVDALTGFVTDL